MKKKSFNKRLELNKTIVSNLNKVDLKDAKGGTTGDTDLFCLPTNLQYTCIGPACETVDCPDSEDGSCYWQICDPSPR